MNLTSDFGFEPCRKERCKIVSLHPAHESANGRLRVRNKQCPQCKADLVHLPHKRLGCTSTACGWIGRNAEVKTKQQIKKDTTCVS